MTLDTGDWESKFEVKRSNVKVTGNKKENNRFLHIFVKPARSDLSNILRSI